MLGETKKRLEELKAQVGELLLSIDLPQKQQHLAELQDQMQQPGFWDNVENAKLVSKQASDLETFINTWQQLKTDTEDALSLTAADSVDDETENFLDQEAARLEAQYRKSRVLALLSKKYDDHDAIVAIHAGAGGSDAQDWAAMLLRMYLRYFEKKGFKAEILESQKGAEAGIKSVLVHVRGSFAFGLLKTEAGVHRLVRLSPFNPAHTRETSFALVEVLPHLEENEVVGLDPKDIKIEVTTSSGHGGQSVNTTYSAVRITHIPTGLKVSIQNERSQAQNKELALKILTAKVQAVEDEKLAQEKKDIRGEFKSAEWGNQIRSYVLHPYKMVKDHRTGFETSDTEAVLDGEVDDFIEKYLEFTYASRKEK